MKKATLLAILVLTLSCAGQKVFIPYKQVGPYVFGKEEVHGDFDRYLIKKDGVPIYSKQALSDTDAEVGRVFDYLTSSYQQTAQQNALESAYNELISLIRVKLETSEDATERKQYLDALVELTKAKTEAQQKIALGNTQGLSPLQQQLLYQRQMEALKKESFLEQLLKDAIGQAVAASIWKGIYK